MYYQSDCVKKKLMQLCFTNRLYTIRISSLYKIIYLFLFFTQQKNITNNYIKQYMEGSSARVLQIYKYKDWYCCPRDTIRFMKRGYHQSSGEERDAIRRPRVESFIRFLKFDMWVLPTFHFTCKFASLKTKGEILFYRQTASICDLIQLDKIFNLF